jgi:hypothetical protein
MFGVFGTEHEEIKPRKQMFSGTKQDRRDGSVAQVMLVEQRSLITGE